ncbi:FK506-binding protein 5 isoform X2 [Apis cerana]|uniref:FK506-binding protein 5 isoform X2 n=1 Tax=Apis cerana TaxID=7461 RepID=UPI002B22ED8F|nr:FK506-binding protein 5 isoform X2 [Apis cerana]
MGARQSRRSVDITTTPKKEGLPADGGVGDAAAPGDGKLERIEETDTKPTTNGIAPHTDVPEDKDKDKDDATEKEKDKEQQEEVKETKQESGGESPAETAEVTTPTEASTPNTATSPDNKETKKKEKGGEEQENGSGTAGSPVEEKSAVSSPTTENEEAPVAAAAAAAASSPSSPQPPSSAAETKEESSGAASAASSSPLEEKTEEAADPSAPTPAPLEEKKEEVEKLEAEKKAVEVSPAVGGQSAPEPVVEVSVFRVQTVATPSIIERKTSEDIPSLPPSSPPPTPIDSSPLQQAQQAAATATALAAALKLPAEAARSSQHFAPASHHPTASPLDPPSTAVVPAVPSLLPPLPVVVDRDPPDNFQPLVVNGTVEVHPLPVPKARRNSPPAEECSHDNNLPLVGDEKGRIAQQSPESSTTATPTTTRLDPEEIGGRSVENNAVVSEIVSEIVEESVARQESVSEPLSRREEEIRELIEEMIVPDERAREEKEDVLDPVPTIDAIVESEEGPVPVSAERQSEEEEKEEEEEEVLVEAKPALVIPEDEEEVNSRGVADVSRVGQVIPDVETDKLETETTDIAVPVEEILVSEMAEHRPEEEPDRASAPTRPTDECGEAEARHEQESCILAPPPPQPSSSSPSLPESCPDDSAAAPPSPPQLVRAEPRILDFAEEQQQQRRPNESELDVIITPPTTNDESSNRHARNSTSKLERVPSLADEFFPAPAEHTATERQIDSSDRPLPPEQLSPSPTTPLVDHHDDDDDDPARTSTETTAPLPPPSTLPATPSPTSNASITSGLMPFTVDSSQSLLYDDQSNREFKMESVSISLNSYNESDIELKERLAESLAETEKQEESLVSCQLLNNATSSTTVQETHQSTPEQPEAPVENNVAHDVSTTESSTEPVKVTSPAVPSEVITASPPSAPAITEDVASVAKAIEEIDISDKAVAAATIECNTNEIIAEARYQNNINE